MNRRTTADDPLAVLLALHRTLAAEESLDRQLAAVARTALEIVPADHSSIRVLDARGVELLSAARAGEGVEHRPVTFGRGLGVAGWVVDHAQTARIDDVSHDPRYARFAGQGWQITSMLCVPLMVGGTVIGCLTLCSSEVGAFQERDAQLAEILAATAVSPIEHARLERIAFSDARTQAFNVRYLQPRIAGEIRRAREHGGTFAVALVEIDGLAEIRDRWGRGTVDGALRVAVDRVLGVLRESDALVRRDAGELFVVMPGAHAGDASAMAWHIRAALSKRVTELGPGIDIQVGCTIGVVVWDGAETARRLERRADAAVRAARAIGEGETYLDAPETPG